MKHAANPTRSRVWLHGNTGHMHTEGYRDVRLNAIEMLVQERLDTFVNHELIRARPDLSDYALIARGLLGSWAQCTPEQIDAA